MDEQLASLLTLIKENNVNYEYRTSLVYQALAQASLLGYECGIRVDDVKWPVVVIKLPSGEVAWHCQASGLEYDGHTDEEKFARIDQFAENVENVKSGKIKLGGRGLSSINITSNGLTIIGGN